MTDTSREAGGRLVRDVWVRWATGQPKAKPSWLVPWDRLDAGQREVDCRIAETVTAAERSRMFVAVRHIIPLGAPWRSEALDLINAVLHPEDPTPGVPEGEGLLMTEPDVRCDWEEACNCGEGEAQCRNSSRFAVERSDHDPSYNVSSDRAPTEACETHVADTIFDLMDGNDKITAIVTPRWI